MNCILCVSLAQTLCNALGQQCVGLAQIAWLLRVCQPNVHFQLKITQLDGGQLICVSTAG